MERKSGTVQNFSAIKGFGFIKPDDTPTKDIFVHYSQIVMDGYRKLEQGDRVSYTIGENHKGPMAVDVRPDGQDDLV